MKNKIAIIFLAFNLIFFSCSEDETPLPQELEIEILNVDLAEGKIELRGTPLIQGQTGEWEISSNNQVAGVFSNKSSFKTFLKGNIYEEYQIKWTISNSNSEISYHIIHRMSAGYSLAELLEADRDIKKLLSFYTFYELISVQSSHKPSFNELIEAGVSLRELLNFISINELYDGGITISQMIEEGLTLREIFDELVQRYNYVGNYRDGIIIDGLAQAFINEGFSVNELINAGISMERLYFYGITIEQFISNGLSFKEIILLGNTRITSLYFIENNFNSQKLIDEGIIEETPLTGFYILNYLHNPISGNNETANTIEIINNNLVGMKGWRLPTIDELNFIYQNRNSLDLKVDIDKLYADRKEDFYDYRNYWISSTRERSCLSNLPYQLNLNFKSGNVTTFCQSWSVAYLLPVVQL